MSNAYTFWPFFRYYPLVVGLWLWGCVTASAMENQYDLSHLIGHFVSAGAIVGSGFGFLPTIAALVAIVWYGIQIYEWEKIQQWLRTRRQRKVKRLEKKLEDLKSNLEQ